jgi:hypothetical protein
MTKKLRKLAMFAVLSVAVGAAALTSCGKDDEVINDVPAMELRLAEPPIVDTVIVRESNMDIFYWHFDYCEDADGNKVRCMICREGYTIFGVCAIRVSLPTIGDGDIHVVTRLRGDGKIRELEVESANMPLDAKNSFMELLDEGTITFAENCPITDPELLAVSKTDHIPAGTYPIRLENDNFVITISE